MRSVYLSVADYDALVAKIESLRKEVEAQKSTCIIWRNRATYAEKALQEAIHPKIKPIEFNWRA